MSIQERTTKTIFNIEKEIEKPAIYFPKFIDIYRQSIIKDFTLFYDDMVLISVKTSNSFEEIERMVYWKYRAFSQGLSRFMEKENKTTENGETPDVGAESKKMMRNAKSSLPKPKMPKMK